MPNATTAPTKTTSGHPNLGIRMAPAIRKRLERAAKLEKRKLSDWCRLALIAAADQALAKKNPA